MKPDPEPWYSTTLNLWTLAGVVVAGWTLHKPLTEGWSRTVGRRRYATTRHRKIAPGARHDYVESLFSEPTWQSTLHCTRIAPAEEPEEADAEELQVERTVRIWLLRSSATWSHGARTTSWFRPWARANETRMRLG
ncbi:hypothetical protein [Streptomyces griseofuscus]|uniref:hypothetical protein n=1 Tax=Streptomyces griseofuscus TaxID=146922 RepID=UPI00382B17AF